MDQEQAEILMRYAHRAHDRVPPADRETINVWADVYRRADFDTTMVAMREMIRECTYLPKPGEVLARAREIARNRQARDHARLQIEGRPAAAQPWVAATSFYNAVWPAIEAAPIGQRADAAEAACREWLRSRKPVLS